ncbi:polyketide cyclase [Blastococcus sp. MG754426]|nr:polyketide cyclase [Blastococcus sp. MG754426]MCF6511257.1 polyketide cyclase [Blastococcus sp. MG754427]
MPGRLPSRSCTSTSRGPPRGRADPVAAYVFRDEWRVAAAPEAAREVVRAVERWPEWWPSVQSVTPVPTGDGEVWRFVFRTRLPYRMEFEARVLRDDPLRGVRTTVTGRVEGEGRWEVSAVEGGALVAFDWEVRPQLLWMRLLSPVARPVFVWNHRALMEEGGAALAQRLGTRLLAPTVCEPALAPAVVAAAVWPAAALGLRALLRRSGARGQRRRPLRP